MAKVLDALPPPPEDEEKQTEPNVQDDEALLRWVLSHEAVVHLDDLLLRRTRLGLLRRDGGAGLAERLRALTGELLGWDAARWEQEWARYEEIRERFYGVPPADRDRAAA